MENVKSIFHIGEQIVRANASYLIPYTLHCIGTLRYIFDIKTLDDYDDDDDDTALMVMYCFFDPRLFA